MQLIARATPADNAVSTVDFLNIPQSFRHLVITASTAGAMNRATLNVRFNDSTTGYPYASAWEAIIGGATTTNSGSSGTDISSGAGLSINLISNANTYAGTMHIMDYRNTTKFKAVLKQSGSAAGAAGDIIGTDLVGSAWENLAAITKVTVAFGGYNFKGGTVIALYGIP